MRHLPQATVIASSSPPDAVSAATAALALARAATGCAGAWGFVGSAGDSDRAGAHGWGDPGPLGRGWDRGWGGGGGEAAPGGKSLNTPLSASSSTLTSKAIATETEPAAAGPATTGRATKGFGGVTCLRVQYEGLFQEGDSKKAI